LLNRALRGWAPSGGLSRRVRGDLRLSRLDSEAGGYVNFMADDDQAKCKTTTPATYIGVGDHGEGVDICRAVPADGHALARSGRPTRRRRNDD
jgi:hypothetical protein